MEIKHEEESESEFSN